MSPLMYLVVSLAVIQVACGGRRVPPDHSAALVKKIQQMEARLGDVDTLRTELQALKEQNSELKGTIDSLKHENSDQATNIGRMSEQIGQLLGKLRDTGRTHKEPSEGVPEVLPHFMCPVNNDSSCVNKLYPNIHDCTTYWSCHSSTNCVATLIDCPVPYEFSEVEEVCVAPSQSGCTEVTTHAYTGTTNIRAGTTNIEITAAETTAAATSAATTAAAITAATTAPSCTPLPPVLCDSSAWVAFTAEDVTDTPTPYAPLVFEDVILNAGGGYDVTTGKFTAPVAGIYLISYNVLADETTCVSDFAYVTLMHSRFSPSQSGVRTTLQSSGSSSVTMELRAGDQLWVQLFGTGCADLANYDAVNIFSGHIVYQTA